MGLAAAAQTIRRGTDVNAARPAQPTQIEIDAFAGTTGEPIERSGLR
jgi:hypothetical protein